MKVKKVNELKDNNIINKVDYISSYDDIEKYHLESFGNAHYFISNFYKSGDHNRKNNNPHGISYERIHKVFGEPNFQSDYNDSYFWILEYNNELYAVDVNEHEGSMICRLFDDVKSRTYDKQFSMDAQKFYDQLFKQLNEKI